jgi:hypothetical protein
MYFSMRLSFQSFHAFVDGPSAAGGVLQVGSVGLGNVLTLAWGNLKSPHTCAMWPSHARLLLTLDLIRLKLSLNDMFGKN